MVEKVWFWVSDPDFSTMVWSMNCIGDLIVWYELVLKRLHEEPEWSSNHIVEHI